MATERPPRKLSCWIALAILIGVLALVVAIGAAAYRWHVLHEATPAQRAALRRLQAEPVTLPARWKQEDMESRIRVIEANEEFDRLIKPFAACWEAESSPPQRFPSQALASLQSGTTITEEAWTTIAVLTKALQPVIQQSSEAVLLEGYAFDVRRTMGEYSVFQTLFGFGEVAALAGHHYAREGRWHDALNIPLLAILRLTPSEHVHFFASFVEQYVMDPCINSMARLAEQCPDNAVVEATLHTLNEWSANAAPIKSEGALMASTLGSLRQMQHDGYFTELPDGRVGTYYVHLLRDNTPKYVDWMLARIPENHPSRAYLKLAHVYTGLTYWERVGDLESRVDPLYPDAYVVDLLGGYDHAAMMRTYLRARCDLLRLRLAQRLAELRGEPPLTRAEDAVPRYMPTAPVDPYTSGTYRYRTSDKRFYSVGPDGVDDKGALRFRIEPPVTGPGDIWLGD